MSARNMGKAEAPDPIFAAIRRHKEAWDAFGVASRRADEVEAQREGRVVTAAEESASAAAGAFERGCCKAFLRTLPSTETGIVAGLKYAAQIDKDMGQTCNLKKFAKTLHTSPLIAAAPCT
jgi:hypothetical protein